MSSAVASTAIQDLPITAGIDAINWTEVTSRLEAQGWATIENVLEVDQCRAIAGMYDDDSRFRGVVVMARHGFGQGEYKYFAYPLPPIIADMRCGLYAHLTPLANRWNEAMDIAARYPDTHSQFITRCHQAGQSRPTPLLLRYDSGDYNCLHQDLYGEHVFPFQVTFLLSSPEHEFTGGEFVLTEQRPRMQSRAMVVPLRQGDGVIFAVSQRPVHGSRGVYRVNLRHGVSEVRSGRRHTLGVIFHDAQ
jgi:uncharacterized protein